MAWRNARSSGTFTSLFTAVVVIASCLLAPLALKAQQDAASGKPDDAGANAGFAAFLRKYEAAPINFDDHNGWVQLFDGKSLDGWKGNPEIWHVEDGAIVGQSSPEKPSGTTNVFYTKARPANFMLKLEIKLEGAGANGGIQYRSRNVPPKPFEVPPGLSDAQKKQMEDMQRQQEPLIKRNAPWNMAGYQADFDAANIFTGQLYEQDSKRFIITFPGTIVETQKNARTLLGKLESPEQLRSYLKPGDWNQVEIIADGHLLVHIINGHIFSETVDNDPENYVKSGLIGLEIEGPGVVKISHRNIWLKELP